MTAFDTRKTQRIGFLLVQNFALMSYASAVEPLRAANLIAGLDLYSALPLSLHGRPVASSSGLTVECTELTALGETCHTVFVCAGGNPKDWSTVEDAHPVLRRLARKGVRIGGISSGAYVLAAAGLLDTRALTVHWDHAGLLKAAFPAVAPRQARYVIDGDRVTCAGGVAPLDLMHAMISERMGAHFARRVSDWYLHTAVAEPGAPQRGSSAERHGTNHPALLTVLEKMETTIESPLDRQTMAKLAGTSARHLDRLFATHLKTTFLETYRAIRLDHARRLLEQSPLSIAEVAFATGFSSAGHFSGSFKARFGHTPNALRIKISSELK